VMRPLRVDGLANMPPFVLGLSIIRGAPTPVVDAAALLGHGPAGGVAHEREEQWDANAVGASAPTRFVVLRAGERRVALAVAAVLGVRPLARETLQALPPLLRHADEQVVAAIGTLDAGLLTVLAGSYLVPPSLWTALAPSKASS
jgi:purine-binding chemotaxis protein CheW